MGRVKEFWMDEKERIADEYVAGTLSRQDAMYQLMRLGLDPHEAADCIDMAHQ